MRKFIRIGVDLGKNFFQVHALESEGGPVFRRKVTRAGLRKFFEETEPCLVAMEACGSAHYWGRELAAMGFEARLIPPAYVKPYVKRGKNDAADAAAICEAASRPDMRFVPIKSAQAQAALALHKSRELLVKQRTMTVNALRAHLAEFGVVAAKGSRHVAALIEKAAGDANVPAALRAALDALVQLIETLGREIKALEEQIAKRLAKEETCRRLMRIPGVGKIAATAIVASLPDARVFASGRDFAAWLGLTPRQNSSGGKERLGGVTKRGNRYLRKLLTLGGTSLLAPAHKRKGALADWIVALCARKPKRLVSLAIANKLARIVWATLTSGELFRQENFAKA